MIFLNFLFINKWVFYAFFYIHILPSKKYSTILFVNICVKFDTKFSLSYMIFISIWLMVSMNTKYTFPSHFRCRLLQSSGNIYQGSLPRRPSVCPSVCASQKLTQPTPRKQLVRFHPNFTGMISTKSSCVYCQHFPFQWFFLELWPFIFFSF